MTTIGLDLSTTCSGFAIFRDGKLEKYGRIKPKTTLDVLDRIEYITKELFLVLKNEELGENPIFIIENIYLGYFKGKNQVVGFGNLGRISGAIMAMLWMMFDFGAKNIILRNANVARPMVGLKGTCQKAEVQKWVLKTFFQKDVSDYEGLIEAVQAKKNVGDIDQKEYRKRMNGISKIIEDETGFGEDVCDAILLGAGGVK